MPPLHLPCSHLRLRVSSSPPPPPILFSLRPTPRPTRFKSTSQNLPARDRVIDFGKHKGRMLGTLPSKYLLWVSKNLRARDFEEWARLADEVLDDPVYKDRIEWEAAEKVLTGDGVRSLGSGSGSSVSELLEISQRFGWDNDDKARWARVDFERLGTSMGGRIPRVKTELMGEMGSPELDRRSKAAMKGGMLGGDSTVSARGEKKLEVLGTNSIVSKHGEMGSLARDWRSREGRKAGFFSTELKDLMRQKRGSLEKETGVGMRDGDFRNGTKLGFFTRGQRCYIEDERKEEDLVSERREERRDRRRLQREQQMETLKREAAIGENRNRRGGEVFVEKGITCANGLSVNPFPGRGALLDKIKRQRD